MEENNIMYRFSNIELEQFAIFEENYIPGNQNMQIMTDAQFAYNKENPVFCSKVTVNLLIEDKPLLKAELNSLFEINPDSIEFLRKDEKIVFKKELLIQFASLCYGTLRGVIYEKTRNTILSSFILPPLYFNEVIDQEFEVE